MLICSIREALVNLGEDHDDLILVDIGDRFVVDGGLIKLYLLSVRAASKDQR